MGTTPFAAIMTKDGHDQQQTMPVCFFNVTGWRSCIFCGWLLRVLPLLMWFWYFWPRTRHRGRTLFAAIMTKDGHDQQQTMPVYFFYITDEGHASFVVDCWGCCLCCCEFDIFWLQTRHRGHVFVGGRGGDMQSPRQQCLLWSWSTTATVHSKQYVWPLPVCSGELAMWLLFDCCVFVVFFCGGGDMQSPRQQLCCHRGLQRPRSAANKMCGLYLCVHGSLQCCCLIVVFLSYLLLLVEICSRRGSNFCCNRCLQRHGPQQARCVASTCMSRGACNVVVVWLLRFCRIYGCRWRYAAADATTFALIRCNVEWSQSTANKSYVVCT
jgi:hypothetical protein